LAFFFLLHDNHPPGPLTLVVEDRGVVLQEGVMMVVKEEGKEVVVVAQ